MSRGAEEALAALLADRPVTAARWGLERIRRLLEELGHPERSFASLHVGGTNGKGSCAAFAAALLRATGRRTGLYTSPHLVHIGERFAIDDRPVPEALLAAAADRVGACAAAGDATYFEATTAVAYEAFAAAGVSHAIIEVGLGGRLDATNTLVPRATAITSIGLDHAELLGTTAAAIAGEKAGILKPGTPACFGPIAGEPLAVLLRAAEAVGAPAYRVGVDARIDAIEVSGAGTRFRYASEGWPEGLALSTRLCGRHQAANAALAVLAVERSGVPLSGEEARRGIADARLPGRFEILSREDGTWVLDIAHNPDGVDSLLAALTEVSPPRPWVGVVAILRDKPWRTMLERLGAVLDGAVLTRAASAPEARRWEPGAALEAFPGGSTAARTAASMVDALAIAREIGGDGTVVVTGSAHTVGEARTLLGISAGADRAEVGS